MPLIGGLVGGIGSGLAGLFGGGKQQKVQTSGTITNNSSGSSSGSFNSSTNPNLTPLQQSLITQFTQGASNLYNQSTNLQPYEASGMEQINQGSDAASKAMAANLASRGLTFSPAAGNAQTAATLARTGQQAQFANSIPLLGRQMQQQSLGQLMNAFQVIPTGTTSAGTTTQNSTQTQNGTNLVSGNPIAGALSGATSGGLTGFGLGGLYNYMQSSPSASSQTGWTGSFAPPGGYDDSGLGTGYNL